MQEFVFLGELNGLVREAFRWQEKFDRLDPRTEEQQVELRRICQNWDIANFALVEYCMRHGEALRRELDDDGHR